MEKQNKTAILGIGLFFLLIGIFIFQMLQRRMNSDPLLSAENVVDEQKEKLKASAKSIYEKVGEYGLEHNYKEKGIMFDFSLTTSTDEVVAGNTLNYEGEKATSGKLFLDVDGSIQTIENLKIGPYYCINEGTIICNSDNQIDTAVIKYKDWNVGSIVTLQNKSRWQVVKNDLKYSKKITLASLDILDINQDGKITEEDMLQYDSKGKTEYKVEEGNIGYNLNQYFGGSNISVSSVRLLTKEEAEKLKTVVDLSKQAFWIQDVKDKKVATYSDKITYQKATDKAYVRPVIEITKDQIVD